MRYCKCYNKLFGAQTWGFTAAPDGWCFQLFAFELALCRFSQMYPISLDQQSLALFMGCAKIGIPNPETHAFDYFITGSSLPRFLLFRPPFVESSTCDLPPQCHNHSYNVSAPENMQSKLQLFPLILPQRTSVKISIIFNPR